MNAPLPPHTRLGRPAIAAACCALAILVSPVTFASPPVNVLTEFPSEAAARGGATERRVVNKPTPQPTASGISQSAALAKCQDAPSPVPMKTLPAGQIRPSQPEPPSLAILKESPPYQEDNGRRDPEREAAVRQAAISLGMRAGFNRGIWCHQQEIDAMSATLSKMYNFAALLEPAGGPYLYEPGIVTEEFNNSIVSRDGTKASFAAARIALLSKEAIVIGPRAWTDYLTFSVEPLAPVDPHTRPRSEDKAQWEVWVADGWNRGVKQAAQTVLVEWNRLDRDYIGMINYKRLVQEKRLDPQRTMVVDTGVTGNHDEMRVGVVDIETKRRSQLQPDPSRWQALPFVTEPQAAPAPFQPLGAQE